MYHLHGNIPLNEALVQTVAAEVDGCENVSVVKLHTDAIDPAGSGADSNSL